MMLDLDHKLVMIPLVITSLQGLFYSIRTHHTHSQMSGCLIERQDRGFPLLYLWYYLKTLKRLYCSYTFFLLPSLIASFFLNLLFRYVYYDYILSVYQTHSLLRFYSLFSSGAWATAFPGCKPCQSCAHLSCLHIHARLYVRIP